LPATNLFWQNITDGEKRFLPPRLQVEKHFRDRLLDLIPSIGSSIGGKPRYCCPYQGCFYEHHYKWIIAKHYGIKHRVAKQFYDEVTGATGRGHFDAAKSVTKVTPQDQSNFQVSML
jgi:hypothetical protein